MVKKRQYTNVYIFTESGIFHSMCQIQWNKIFIHFMAGNRRFFSIRLDTVKKEKENV